LGKFKQISIEQQLDNWRNDLAVALFGMTNEEAQREGLCICCKEAVDQSSMADEEKQKYEVHALCPICYSNHSVAWDRRKA